MARTTHIIFWFAIVALYHVNTLVAASNARIKSIAVDHPKYQKTLSNLNISELWITQHAADAVVWQNVASIVARIKEQSNCGSHATDLLFFESRIISNSTQDARLLDNLQALYAARMAICENLKGSVKVPKPCQGIMLVDNLHVDLETQAEADLHVIRHVGIGRCITGLQAEHYYWTSYANKRQDARAICEASRLEIEHRQMLRVARKIFEDLIDYTRVMEELRVFSEQWMQATEQRNDATAKAYEEHFSNLATQSERLRRQAVQDIQSMQSKAKDASDAISNIAPAAQTAADQIKKVISDFESSLDTMKGAVAKLFVEANQEIVSVVQPLAFDIRAFSALFMDITNDVRSSLLPYVEHLNLQLGNLTHNADDIIAKQQQSLGILDQQNQWIERQLQRQHEMLEMSAATLSNLAFMATTLQFLSGPINLASSILAVIYDSPATAIFELALFSLVVTSSLLLRLILRQQMFALYLALSYVCCTSLRIVLHFGNIKDKVYAIKTLIETAPAEHSQNKWLILLLVAMVVAKIVRSGLKRRSLQRAQDEAEQGKQQATKEPHLRRVARSMSSSWERVQLAHYNVHDDGTASSPF